MQLKLFNRLATIQDDGTVQFEVPGDIKPGKLDFGTGVVYNGASDEAANDVADIPVLPPLQIVMLIVGTRGDVQPFVAIGKKLQVYLPFLLNKHNYLLLSDLQHFLFYLCACFSYELVISYIHLYDP